MTATMRKHLRRVHLWLGLSLGLLFVLLGLTGSALVFYIEIDAALHPAVQANAAAPAPGWTSPVWDRALATGRTQWPDRAGSWELEATGDGGTIPARYYPPNQGHHAGREMIWFSSDGTHVIRSAPWGGYLMSWLYKLHMELLAGDVGHQIVGWSGFAILLLLITGMAVWWPRGSWRKALAFKRKAVAIRRLRDIHKHAGLWSGALLAILVLTGIFLALPDVKSSTLAGVTASSTEAVPDPSSAASSGTQISVTEALASAHQAVPGARLAFIRVPGTGSGAFRIRVQVPGDPHFRFPSSFVFVDQYSGDVLAVHDVRSGNASTILGAWIRVFHDGSIAGLAGRALAVLLGLVPAALYITGFLHWRRLIARAAHSSINIQ